MKNKLLMFICLTISLFSKCGLEDFVRKNVRKPQVKFAGAKIDGLSFESLDLVFDLEITNPNPAGVHLNEFEYNLSLNGNSFLHGQQEKGLEIKSRGREIVRVPLTLDYANIYNTLTSFKNRDSTDYEISVVLSFFVQVVGVPVKVPVKKQGSLPLIKPPKLKISSLKLNHLGLTGADFILAVQLNNPNAFSFNLEQMNYDFIINNESWLNANSLDKVTLPAKGKNIITFPITLNFLQIGRSAYDLIQNNRPLQYRFKGDLNLTSSLQILDSINLPFDHSGEIQISR